MSLRPALTLATAALAHASSWAHGGHGAIGETHWHASDAFGFLLVGALVALAIWLSRGGK